MIVIIIALLLLIVYLVFVVPIRIRFHFLLDREMKFSAAWPPWLKIESTLDQGRILISVLLFRWKIVSNRMRRKKAAGPAVWKAISIHGTTIKTRYGLNAPHLTGLMLAPVSAIGYLSWVRNFEVVPDFFPTEEYFYIEGSTMLNVGETILNLIGLKSKRRNAND